MIRYKEKEFEQWSICPATGDIFNSTTGEVQPVKIFRGRPVFKKMSVHRIMAHTFYGYKPEMDVHHKDENKMNNCLSNLVYLTRSEHMKLHMTELLNADRNKKISIANAGKIRSQEQKEAYSLAQKKRYAEKGSPLKGRKCPTETREKISLSLKDHDVPLEQLQKIRDTLLKFYENPENRKKQSQRMKEYYSDPMNRQKQINAGKKNREKTWWTNGKETKFSKESPGEGWSRGRGRLKKNVD